MMAVKPAELDVAPVWLFWRGAAKELGTFTLLSMSRKMRSASRPVPPFASTKLTIAELVPLPQSPSTLLE